MIETTRSLGAVAEVLRIAGLLREFHGPGDLLVKGVCQDSRKVRPGDLFLAWRGGLFDAHDFVSAAVLNGAIAAVVERKVDAEIPQLVVSDGRRSAALAAYEVMNSGSAPIFTVGVTGTNGKTTTALLARHLMELKGPAATIGTLGVLDNRGIRPGTEGLTTPGPVEVAIFLRQLADGAIEAVVMEASSHALDQHRIDGVLFDVGVFTNLSHDHLDYHGDIDEYFSAKARLAELVTSRGTLVVNGDDPAWNGLDSNGRSVRTFALKNQAADVCAESVRVGPNGSKFILAVDGERRNVELPLLARFNIENALAAAAVGAAYGLSIDEIASGLSSAPQVAGRLETVITEPFTVLIDFAHTPAALSSVLGALRPLTKGRLIVVFGAGGDRDRLKRAPMAAAVAKIADVMVLTSDNPRNEDPDQILDDLVPGLEGRVYERVVDRDKAIRVAFASAQEGDTVVLAGKGHETYQVVGDEYRPFDERVIVRDCLAELGVG